MQKKVMTGQNKTVRSKKGKNKLYQKVIKAVSILLIMLSVLTGAGAVTVVYSFVNESPDFNTWIPHSSLSSRIYDRSGNEITTFYGVENRIEIPLEEMPLHVQNAFIAIEDERFYEHLGVDLWALTRAFVSNLRQGSWTDQGGSTITQQLVKNTILTREKTLTRKMKEAWLAIKLERRFSKDEILEMYLNHIYFAHGAYGIEAAGRLYFDKNSDQLTVAEAALLAGIPRSPNNYSPFINLDVALQRQSLVLQKMYELEYIDNEQLLEAKEQDIVLSGTRPTREYPFPYFIDYLLHNELINILTGLPGFSSRTEAYEAIYNMGLRIYTTMDSKTQSVTEMVLSDESLYHQDFRVDMTRMKQLMETGVYTSYPEEALSGEGILQPQSAAVVADPSTGEILALVGGRDYGEGNQDLRYLSPRQPGSAIKPIVTYAPALEEKLITPGSVIDDSPVTWGDWAPENFGGGFRGLVTVRESVAKSLNVPAAKLFAQLTPKVGLKYAERMGITTFHPDDYNLAATLGGVTKGVTAFDMAQAYSVLANDGIRQNLHTVKRIEDRSGNVLYEHRKNPEAVLSPQTAYLITDMLKDVVQRGTASNLTIVRPLAAKTGTTTDNRDAYLVAYTPEMVVSFWMGHDIQSLGRISGGSGSAIAFMNAILSQVLEDVPPSDFKVPPGIIGPLSICGKSGLKPGIFCPEEVIIEEIFPSAELPQESCDLHIQLRVCTASGNLAGYSCPDWQTQRRTFLLRPDFLLTDERWRGKTGRGPDDAGLMPPEEYCQAHSWWQRFRPWQRAG